jgi:hypothetical protein
MTNLLIHHWDTDGLCAGTMLKQEVDGEWERFTPTIGNYFLTPEEIEWIGSRDFERAIITDMALPVEHVLAVKEGLAAGDRDAMRIYDHHLQPVIDGVQHNNPIARGGDPKKIPSATWVVMEAFGRNPDLLAALGAVGDHEVRLNLLKEAYQVVLEVAGLLDVTFHDLIQMVKLIDASYKMDDRAGVYQVASLLEEMSSDPEKILGNPDLQKRAESVDREIEKWVHASPEDVQGILVLRMDTGYHIVSTVGRQLAWQSGRVSVIVNTGLDRQDQLYARGCDMTRVIEFSRGRGYRAGGKAEVVGVVLPKKDLEAFLPEFLEKIRGSMRKE